MPYTLEQFAADCRAALSADAGPRGREQVCRYVQRALRDEAFVATHLGDDAESERTVLYEDADLGFCICAHVYRGPKQGSPHDHGPTWAIYGQASGETEMTDWRVVTPAQDGRPARIELERTYTLAPGDVHLYPEGAVHAPLRAGPTKLVRIEGSNTERLERTPIEPV